MSAEDTLLDEFVDALWLEGLPNMGTDEKGKPLGDHVREVLRWSPAVKMYARPETP